MTSQLDLLGGETPLRNESVNISRSPRALTDRQQVALQYITAAGPTGVSSDDLGAHLHGWNRTQGRRGHDPDTRCDYCGHTGKELGQALRARGLVYQRDRRYWTLTEHRGTDTTTPEQRTYDPRTADIPF